jgi:hypothetical protein
MSSFWAAAVVPGWGMWVVVSGIPRHLLCGYKVTLLSNVIANPEGVKQSH